MNILAIDYGTRRIGLAWVETGLGVVLPYGIVTHDAKRFPESLLEIITTDNPEKIVIGLPRSTTDARKETPNEVRVRAFGDGLAEATGKEVLYVDERFSSQQADNTPGDVSRDEKSAMIILESYLAAQ
jgi:putative Holliday junction resolvase